MSLLALDINIGVTFLLSHIQKIAGTYGLNITEFWHDDADIIIKTQSPDAKIKLRIVSHRNTFAGIEVRKIVAGVGSGMLKTNIPVPGKVLGLVKGSIEKLIRDKVPFAHVKVEGDTLYLENLLSDNFRMEQGQLKGELFLTKI